MYNMRTCHHLCHFDCLILVVYVSCNIIACIYSYLTLTSLCIFMKYIIMTTYHLYDFGNFDSIGNGSIHYVYFD